MSREPQLPRIGNLNVAERVCHVSTDTNAGSVLLTSRKFSIVLGTLAPLSLIPFTAHGGAILSTILVCRIKFEAPILSAGS